ncbi:MAG: S41 family peptidase [Candidatus Pacebacteria bacterium]|nr:S41 family peptidase [Candidatus Paceibacterota bacterium]
MSVETNSSHRSKEKDLSVISKRGLGLFLALLLAGGAFFSGLQVGQLSITSDDQSASIFSLFSLTPSSTEAATRPDLAEFWRVWDLLEEKFAVSSTSSALGDEDRVRGAIEGLVDSYGDPYTVYMPPEDAEKFDQNISGNFSGVGMEVGLREGIITVIAPLPDTPAERAGILAGDVVVKIDEKSTEKMSVDEAVSLIRGEKGTIVNLQIYREGEAEFLDIPITRDTINIPTIKHEQIGDSFIIAIYSFNAVAETQVEEALVEYQKSNAKSLIIDVRGNPGGYMQSAVAIASYFLPAGKVVVKEEFSDNSMNEVFRSRGRQIQNFTPKNLVVLVDNGSASASEILAGALKDHGVATIIGSQTFGKGSVQELVKLDGGASLKVTVARWLTPNGVSISEGGLAPDIIINRTIADRQSDVDPQKDAAIRFLKGEVVVSEELIDSDTASTTSSGE